MSHTRDEILYVADCADQLGLAKTSEMLRAYAALLDSEPVAWMVLEPSIKYKATFNYELHARNTARNMSVDGYEPTFHPLIPSPCKD